MKISIAIPAYNEEAMLEKNINTLVAFCRQHFSGNFQIVIADNNSSDRTAAIGRNLAAQNPEVTYLFVSQQGKGIAIKTAWDKFEADIYCFMDADLATDLTALPELVAGICQQGYDLVVGSRCHPQSKVSRSLIRKIISLGYRLVFKILLGIKVNDLPCGFKAINNRVKKEILPQIKNPGWFFDSELVIISEKNACKIKEIPVVWHDPREGQDKSKVKVLSLSIRYFQEIIKMRKRLKNAGKL